MSMPRIKDCTPKKRTAKSDLNVLILGIVFSFSVVISEQSILNVHGKKWGLFRGQSS